MTKPASSAEMDCPECGRSAAVTWSADQGTLRYRCAFTTGHPSDAAYVWTVEKRRSPAKSTGWAATGGVTADLVAPLDHILAAFPHMWIEHGVIEYQLRKQYPQLFGKHVAERGHVLLDEKTSSNTASGVRFATALRRLEHDDVVTHYTAKPTGTAWAHDHTVGYWARVPAPDQHRVLTWLEYATAELGRTDGSWTDDDRTEVQELAAQARSSDKPSLAGLPKRAARVGLPPIATTGGPVSVIMVMLCAGKPTVGHSWRISGVLYRTEHGPVQLHPKWPERYLQDADNSLDTEWAYLAGRISDGSFGNGYTYEIESHDLATVEDIDKLVRQREAQIRQSGPFGPVAGTFNSSDAVDADFAWMPAVVLADLRGEVALVATSPGARLTVARDGVILDPTPFRPVEHEAERDGAPSWPLERGKTHVLRWGTGAAALDVDDQGTWTIKPLPVGTERPK